MVAVRTDAALYPEMYNGSGSARVGAALHSPVQGLHQSYATPRSDIFSRQLTAVTGLCEDIDRQGLKPGERLAVLLELQHFWQQWQSELKLLPVQQGFIDGLLQTAEYLCHWQLYAEVLAFARQQFQSAGHYYSLQHSWSAFKMGQPLVARDRLLPLLISEPDNRELLHNYRYMVQPGVADVVHCSDNSLFLVPLAHHHLQDFYWQYDEQIADLCNLPEFCSDRHWHDWLHWNQQNRHKHLYAVMHWHWGFVGSVCLEIHRGSGFFYYWLGQDFQGKGLGPKAVSALLDLGYQQLGMQRCYAKVYDHNLASVRAIQKLGFEMLRFAALPPYDNELFFYLGSPRPDHVRHQELACLLTDLGSEIRLQGIYGGWL